MVKPRHFSIGDLILKRVSLATKNPTHGNWDLIGKDPIGLLISKARIILFRSPRREKARAPLECRAFKKILTVRY